MAQWFRFYSETTTDRKIDRICRATNQNKATIIGAWSIIMALASDSPIRGAVLLTEDHPFTLEDIAAELGLDDELTARIVNQFIDFSMMHQEAGIFYLTNWDKRQFASDDSTERVRRYRERQRTQDEHECNSDETLQGRDGNAPETETETETEPEAETEKRGATAPPAPPKRSRRTKDPPPPAVQRYRSVTNLYPEKALWPGIAQVVGDDPNRLNQWEGIITSWLACGWNKRNVKGMLECLVEERIPGDGHRREPETKERTIQEIMGTEYAEWIET